jgi:hypothetical protein
MQYHRLISLSNHSHEEDEVEIDGAYPEEEIEPHEITPEMQ